MVNAGGARLAMSSGMRVSTTLPAIWRESLRASAEGVRACEKPNESGTSGDDGRGFPRDTRRKPPHLTIKLVCQGETKARDPFRDSPRLQPAFVTQLLAQLMTSDERPSPRPVYGEKDKREALLFDARV